MATMEGLGLWRRQTAEGNGDGKRGGYKELFIPDP